tara:strand:- start:898 stop:1278 length:381 start_codon:yes stop_codon:yes gene_type:complete
MTNDDEAEILEELLEGHRPAVKQAMRAALRAINDEKRSPKDDYKSLATLGKALVGGGAPPVAIIISAVEASLSLLRYHRKKRRQRINRSRAKGMSAGLAAYQASKIASARGNARGAGKSRRRRYGR